MEDDPGDVWLVREALTKGEYSYHLCVVEDGAEALKFLRHHEPFQNAPRPHVILLDWNLPRLNGREVLAEIKQDQTLCEIPVVVLTTSSAQRDIQGAYDEHANCFITKPSNVQEFFDVIRAIEHFWVNTVILPRF